MSENERDFGPPMDRLDRATLIRFAREIVIGELLVVDLEDQDWSSSMALILFLLFKEAAPPSNVGTILVPVQPHLRGYWLNNRVPAVALEAFMVPTEDLAELNRLVDGMRAALHPESDE